MLWHMLCVFFFFKQKTAYEMRISDWSSDVCSSDLVSDMATLIARLGCAQVDLVGTSMGGLIGLLLAAQPGTPLRRLAMNDVGPFIPKAALARILDYVGKDPRFADLAAAEAYHQIGRAHV